MKILICIKRCYDYSCYLFILLNVYNFIFGLKCDIIIYVICSLLKKKIMFKLGFKLVED